MFRKFFRFPIVIHMYYVTRVAGNYGGTIVTMVRFGDFTILAGTMVTRKYGKSAPFGGELLIVFGGFGGLGNNVMGV